MKRLISLMFLVSCAHQNLKVEDPNWVSMLRTGDESLKVQNGQKTFYRRIAGGPDMSKQTACELVIHKAEEDIKKEYPQMSAVPYTVEVLYYSEEKKDCAVTLSLNHEVERDLASVQVPSVERLNELKAKESASDVEVAEILQLRSEVAQKYALTGLKLDEFEKYTKEKVVVMNGEGLCAKTFRSTNFSIHGLVEVCWQNDHIRGYCTTRSQQCWIRTP